MISADKALELVLLNSLQGDNEKISITVGSSRILAEDILAERNDPPFDRVLKDGIAIQFEHLQYSRSFPVEGITRAGSPQDTLKDQKSCFEVMTGCPLPKGADTVVMYEDLEIKDGIAHIAEHSLCAGDNVEKEGSNHIKEDTLLKVGTLLQSPQIGIIASQGMAQVEVIKKPKISVITSGDEIVDLGDTLAPHQIRASNRYTMLSELKGHGLSNIGHVHIPDDREKTEHELKLALEKNDVVILSGGVSKGKFDFIPTTLDKLGVTKVFHKVKQKPGKPFWFGTKGKTLIFALPGNPISTLACLRRYVIPSLNKLQGKEISPKMAKLENQVMSDIGRTDFVPAKLSFNSDATITATPQLFNTSGHYSSLDGSNGLIVLPEGKAQFEQGELVEFLLWGSTGGIC